MTNYFDELDRRFVGGFASAAALDDALVSLNPPAGLLVVATLAALDPAGAVACGGIQWCDATTAETRR